MQSGQKLPETVLDAQLGQVTSELIRRPDPYLGLGRLIGGIPGRWELSSDPTVSDVMLDHVSDMPAESNQLVLLLVGQRLQAHSAEVHLFPP